MRYLIADLETFYSADYSLKKLSPLEYIRDERFKVHGCAFKWVGQPAFWVTGSDMDAFLADVDWPNVAMITHNANFDMTVFFEKYGISPAKRIDTLGLCRALLYRDMDFGLDQIGPVLGLGGKKNKGKNLTDVKGVRDLTPEQEESLAEYAIVDAEITEGIFNMLWPNLPETEREVMNLVIRFSTEGVLEGDAAMFDEARQEIIEDRANKLAKAGVDATTLRSAPKFAELLRARGVEPPTRISITKKNPDGAETYSFSKQDPAFIALKADERVSDLVAARLAVSSNSAITRIDRLDKISSLAPYTIPVLLNYNGAHTGRLSGGGQINMQNLNARGVGKKLRLAIRAPKDHVIVVNDLSGIELRTNMWFSGQHDVLDLIRKGGDVYILEASRQFRCSPEAIDKKTTEGNQRRQYGKIVQLGAGFGMGKDRFKEFCAAGPLGMSPIYVSDAQAYETIQTYRFNHSAVKNSWDWLSYIATPLMASKNSSEVRGPVCVEHEAIRLPNGLALKYPGLRATEDGWVWGIGNVEHRLWGGILQENCIAAGTQVLTNHGWKSIEQIQPTDLVHDGIEFVTHGGLASKSVQECVTIDGVFMTPDHEVLTNDGWKPALAQPEPYRPDLRDVDRLAPSAQYGEETSMGVPLPMRTIDRENRYGSNQSGQTRRDPKLRMPNKNSNVQTRYSRDEQAPSLRGVAVHARSLSATLAPGVEKLRRAWHYSLRAMDQFRTVLARYGADLSAWTNSGAGRQQWAVQSGQLPMGFNARAGAKPAKLPANRYTQPSQGDRNPSFNPVLQTQTRPVFDILDCGPRHRFVVRGNNGPFIVHNCVQALAGVIIKEQMVEIEKELDGLGRVVHQVHDEILVVCPEKDAEAVDKLMKEVMRRPRSWAPDLPLEVEGGFDRMYSK